MVMSRSARIACPFRYTHHETLTADVSYDVLFYYRTDELKGQAMWYGNDLLIQERQRQLLRDAARYREAKRAAGQRSQAGWLRSLLGFFEALALVRAGFRPDVSQRPPEARGRRTQSEIS
jgi:hypothetical protein